MEVMEGLDGLDGLEGVDADWEATVEEIDSDQTLLRRLIYRNQSQHGSTFFFRCGLLPLRRILVDISKSRLNCLRTAAMECIKSISGDRKTTTRSVEGLLRCAKASAMVIDACCKAAQYCCKASLLDMRLLKRRVFAALYSVFLGICAGLLRNLAKIALCLDSIRQALINKIKVR